ncbi:MAG: IS66 family transposase [Candidatus Omnitrophota bacterium]|nr:IS66 family transposase [Candidatus Omnitrophota bacterium]
MGTVADTKEKLLSNIDFIVPPLPGEVLSRLPIYCPKPNARNLATQYYYWNRELIKNNLKLQGENKGLKKNLEEAQERMEKLKELNEKLQAEKEKLAMEKDRLRAMLFKTTKPKTITGDKTPPEPRIRASYARPKPDRIDEFKEAILTACPHCQNKLSKKVGFYQRIIEDIPSFNQQQVKTTQYTINRYYCKHCQKIVQAKPMGLLPRARLGPNILLFVLYSKYRLRLPQALILENLKTQFGLKISEGQINNLLSKGELLFKEKWKEIVLKIENAKVVNADETGWRIDGENCWLWVFTNDQAVRYTISEFRGKGVPKDVLGADFNGVVVSDFYSAYNQFQNKQRCWAHLLRKARELSQAKATEQRTQAMKKLSAVYQQIADFRVIANLTQAQKDKKANYIVKKLVKISQIKTKDHNLQKLFNLCGKYANELTVCVRDFNVPPDNNQAERAIRPAVVMRKISGGSRSPKGASIHAFNLSVIETLRKEKQNLFEAMQSLLFRYLASNG